MGSKQLNFSNGYHIINFLDSLIALALCICIYAIPAVISSNAEDFTNHWLIMTLCAVIAVVFPITGTCQNKYIISSSCIRITEYFLCVKTIDVNISFSQIERIETKRIFPYISQSVLYYVDGKSYVMKCTKHRKELVEAIKQKMQL